MLETLNNDCWLEINKYLSLDDQIALYEAFKGISNNLMYDVAFAWEHQRCFSLDPDCYEKFEEMPELLDIFLSSIRATQEMQLHWVTLEFLRLWENYTFPSMKTLEYTLDEDWSVKPYGGFECSTLVKFTQLRQLDLSDWTMDYLPYHCPEELATCPLIEKLIIPIFLYFPEVYEGLMALPKMHTVSFYLNGQDDILAAMLEKRGNDVQKMTFNHCIWKFSVPTFHKLRNLRQLTLLNENRLKPDKLLKVIANLKQLEQLDLINYQMILCEAALWQTVDCCPSLRILNISYMYFKEDFFNGNRCVMEKALSNRSRDLRLNCHNTGENEKLMRQLFKHPRLKLSFVPLPHELDGGRIKVHFEPLLPS
ncbi:uncharacterized protein LOC133837054 isoform X2 [Drosophila sulfurigaster albostrigata]|uniref:uncharacterized protein LOC133837054 isoform X2 n=1 Tax=Drosophila sulfurigaster albostrigata TaxID=89887 RepID=UPI002D219581|nr:uncharacterized protein LOC133837054 isoform X2 [Drosophila sulfurigaster albostrigata]